MTKNLHIYLAETRILLDTEAERKVLLPLWCVIKILSAAGHTVSVSVIDGLSCNFCAILYWTKLCWTGGSVCLCSVVVDKYWGLERHLVNSAAENTPPVCAFPNTFLWTLVTKDCKCINKCFLLFIVIVSFHQRLFSYEDIHGWSWDH